MKTILTIVIVIALVGGVYYYLSKNSSNINQQSMDLNNNGYYKEDLTIGNGKEAQLKDKLTVHYVGTLEDGSKFDSSYDRGTPFQFTLGVGEVIMGWDKGMLGMKVGGKRKLVISPELGYGESGFPPVIPGNSILTFEVELLNVE